MAVSTSKMEHSVEEVMRWPDGWERTHIKDRKPQSSWKKPWSGYVTALLRELQLMGATSVLICRSPNERLDPGVCVWFSLKKQDFSWQSGLGIDSPAPTLQEIEDAYKAKAMKHHPDRGGDIAIFQKLSDYRKQAKAWVLGTHEQQHEYVIPCDRFNEARLNLAALRLAVSAFRSLERVGVPAILERTLDRAFKAALPTEATHVSNA